MALTFDDGPGPSTPAVAEALAELEVPATFFVVGSLADASSDEITALAAAGHTIGGHSWSHPRGETTSDASVVEETERTAELIAELTGRPGRFVRPPYRKSDAARFASVLEPLGFTVVTWSVDPRDWASSDPSEIADAVVEHLHPGAIVVLHDGGRDRRATAEALPLIVDRARRAGYRFIAL